MTIRTRRWVKPVRAFGIPTYQFFRDDEEWAKLLNLPRGSPPDEIAWRSSGEDARFLNKLRRLLDKAGEADRKLILYMTQKMTRH